MVVAAIGMALVEGDSAGTTLLEPTIGIALVSTGGGTTTGTDEGPAAALTVMVE